MSDDVLSVIPTDPSWQPAPAAAERAVALVAELLGDDDGAEQIRAHLWCRHLWCRQL
ncbi:hypothetical protein [Kitasatospora aureofaciens]|uniref:hypothetical protein n=1 Tax=Kitasatospora aureofaciens TaxID=1894 RepID=UPI001C48D385|nr:hypothetical protein [Kitasatospora aureofaciens]MBV6697387.1 hypothetical protein [Kitasatospora aureofaciens]